MANYTVVVADIEVKSLASRVRVVQFGEAGTQGKTVYQRATDQKYYLADANDTVEKAQVKGVLLTKVSAADGYGVILESGEIDLGGTAAVGETYYQSDTAGAISPDADLASGEYVTRVGYGKAADNIVLDIHATGVQHA